MSELTAKGLALIAGQPKPNDRRFMRNQDGTFANAIPMKTHPLPKPAPPPGAGAVKLPPPLPGDDLGMTMKAAKGYAFDRHGIQPDVTALAIQKGEVPGSHRHSNNVAWVVPEVGLESWCVAQKAEEV